MQNNNKYMVGSVITGILAAVAGIVGFVFFIMGRGFVSDPEGITVTINGRTLEGVEAAEKALAIGNAFSGIGGVILVIGAVLGITCAVLLITHYRKN